MTLCVCARVTSRLSTTSAQVSGIHANKRPHARTHARRLGYIILPSSFLSCNASPPGCNRCITTICHPLVGMNHHSIITWHTQGQAGTNARALNYAQSLDQHPPPMAATILNSPSLLSSSLLRCMTLLTMRYSFRLSRSRSKAVRFVFCFPSKEFPR